MRELRVSRRQVLKGAGAVGVLAAMTGPLPVFATDGTVVTVMGNVTTPPGPNAFSVHLGAVARGPADALTGTGFDAPPIGSGASSAPGNPGFCVFPLTGSVSAGVVTLSGAVRESSMKTLIGTPVMVTADTSNGSITFCFGGLMLTGTGSVTVH